MRSAGDRVDGPLWDVVVEVPTACPWDRHDRERLAGELAVVAAVGAAEVLAPPTGCTVRLRLRAHDARSAAWAGVAATERAGRRLGLPLQAVLRPTLQSSSGGSFRRGLPGGPLRSGGS